VSYDEIIKGCWNRDRSAQTAFYNLFAQTMFSTACRLIGDEYEAEDIVQEVLLLPLTGKIQMLDRQADMERRLRRITINETIDRLRKQKNRWDCWEDGIDITADEETDDMLIDAERNGNLRQAIDSLPEKYEYVYGNKCFLSEYHSIGHSERCEKVYIGKELHYDLRGEHYSTEHSKEGKLFDAQCFFTWSRQIHSVRRRRWV
jgi:RNA polymerase sigma-70 factor (ECF subfamily)